MSRGEARSGRYSDQRSIQMVRKNSGRNAVSRWVMLCITLCLVALPSVSGDRRAHADAPVYSRTLADILALPDADVIPSLIGAIRNDPLFRDDDWKHQAYELLVSANGSNSRAAVRQFIVGMNDPAVSCICLYALGTAPKSWHDMIVPRLAQYFDKLLDGTASPCNDISSLFDAISRFGRNSSSMAKDFEYLVRDTLTLPIIRGMAARVLINVVGVVSHVRITESLMAEDTIAGRLMLNVLLLEGESKQWSFLDKTSARKKVSGLLVSQLMAGKKRGVMERITIGSLIIESIARYQPRHAVKFVGPWINALQFVKKHNGFIGVRVHAMIKIKEAKQLMAFAGRN